MLESLISEILAAPSEGARLASIGESREGRSVGAVVLGTGPLRVSLLGGCHADEPIGPETLRRLVTVFQQLPDTHDLLTQFQWWIVPHVNPDGEQRNRWFEPTMTSVPLQQYLANRVRELPGDDIEFGFSRVDARPENRAVLEFWDRAATPFVFHATLHGMAFAGGPWFLLEPSWTERLQVFRKRLEDLVQTMGYSLHDVQRHGEKGFWRISRGFCTRPDSQAMKDFFQDQPEVAAKFSPSSMEAVRAYGGDCLSVVSEMPLFIVKGLGEEIGPPDPVAVMLAESLPKLAAAESTSLEILPMPVTDQMRLQLHLLAESLRELQHR